MSGRLKAAPRGLPRLILMTDPVRLPDPSHVLPELPRHAAVIVRHREASDSKRLAHRLRPICRRRHVLLLVAGDARVALAVGADGLHLPEAMVRHGRRTWRAWRRPGWVVTAAAHSLPAIHAAARAGVDAVLVSPVFPTRSHPDVAPLGPVRFAALVRQSPLPTYALGGVSRSDARRIMAAGAMGFAGISGLTASSRRGTARRDGYSSEGSS